MYTYIGKWTKAYNTQNNKSAFYVEDTTYAFWKYDSVLEHVAMAFVSKSYLLILVYVLYM